MPSPSKIVGALGKHIGIPLAVGGGLYALNAPFSESEESLGRKWMRTRDAWTAGGTTAGLLGGHAVGKAISGSVRNPYAKVLSTILGGITGGLTGYGVIAPAQHLEDVQIRRARHKYPKGINPLTGAPVFATQGQLGMDPATMYKTERWGVQ